MYIRRKVFSLLNVDGEERYFSTTDYTLEQREFGRGKSAQNRKKAKKFRKSNIPSSEQIAGSNNNALEMITKKESRAALPAKETSDGLIKKNNGGELAKVNETVGKVKSESLNAAKNTAKNLEGKAKNGVDLLKKNKKVAGLAALGTAAIVGGGLYAKNKKNKDNS